MNKKTINLVLIFVAFTQISFAQSWFPVGATGYRDDTRGGAELGEDGYPIQGSYGELSQYTKYEVVKDTIVDGLSAKLMIRTHHMADGTTDAPASFIGREENNQVFYYDYPISGDADRKFHLMYDFNLEVGDTLKVELPIYFEEDKYRHIVLAAITTEDYGGTPLEVQHFVLYDKDGISEHWKNDTIKITEKLINSCTMFPFKEITVAPVADANLYCDCAIMESQRCDLRCYLDAQVSYHATNASCDTVFDTRTGIEELANSNIKINYNETLKVGSATNTEEVKSIEVIDILGDRLAEMPNPYMKNNIEIDLSKYHSGTYFLKIHTKNKQYFYKVNRY